MTDIRLKEYRAPLLAVTMDWLLTSTGALDQRDELATAARVALGTDALADSQDILPDPDSSDRRGWWGDYDADYVWDGWPIGCKCWLLYRAKILDVNASEGSTEERANQYVVDALRPFIDRRLASRMEVEARQFDTQTIMVEAQLFRGDKAEIDLRYQLLWEEPPVYDGPVTVPSRGIVIRVPYRNLTLSTTSIAKRFVPTSAQLTLSSQPASRFWTVPPMIIVPLQGNLALSPTNPTRTP